MLQRAFERDYCERLIANALRSPVIERLHAIVEAFIERGRAST